MPEPAAANRIPDADVARIYDVTVKLRNTLGDPVRVIRTEDVCLGDLHVLIQESFGWMSCHLWNFEVGRGEFFGPIMEDKFDSPDWGNADDVWLSGLLDAGMKKFGYLYDFGDGWEHTVSIRQLAVSSAKREVDQQLPRCIKGAGATPPEDCGGSYGYNELVDRSNDSADKDVDEELQWYGLSKPIDTEAFDLDAVNVRLADLERQMIESALTEIVSSDEPELLLIDAGDYGLVITTTTLSEDAVEVSSETISATARAEGTGFCVQVDACFANLAGGDYGDDFFENCRAVLIEAAEQGVQIYSGKVGGWAAAAVNVVAAVNMMNCQYTGNYPTMAEVAKACGVSIATLNNRSKQLREALEIVCPGDMRYLVAAAAQSNFMLSGAIARQVIEMSDLSHIAALGLAQHLPQIQQLLDGRPLLGVQQISREELEQFKSTLSEMDDSMQMRPLPSA